MVQPDMADGLSHITISRGTPRGVLKKGQVLKNTWQVIGQTICLTLTITD